MPSKLTTTNPENLEYTNDLLGMSVLGGIRLEGLDKMRVTLKVKLQGTDRPPVRHNLDLYNDTQLEKFIRKVAERLEIGTSIIAASISELTEELEVYRLEELKKQELESIIQPKHLTEEEVRAARAFLEEPDLLIRTNELIGQSGVIGEENNRLLMYIIYTSRKRSQPLHIVSLGSSGAGKTHLQEKVGQLIPEEDRVEITTLSENAFYYFGQRELKNKLILIEDLDGAENVLYPLRELQSKKKISKTIAHKNSKGETRTMHLVVEGPLSVSGCTTREHIYEDNANRSFLIYLDESPDQDKKIMEYQRAISAGRVDHEAEETAAELLRNCQRILEPIKIVNPYAEELTLPEEVFKPRRTNNHYLQFIEAVTFYHQRQRPERVIEETGEVYIETTLEDIEYANELLQDILLRKSDELTGACRNYLEQVKDYLATRDQVGEEQEPITSFSNLEIRKALRVNANNQKRYNVSLLENYYIRKVSGKKGTRYVYEVVSLEEFEGLKGQIINVLEENLKKLQEAETKLKKKSDLPAGRQSRFTGSVVVQKENEPVKLKKTK